MYSRRQVAQRLEEDSRLESPLIRHSYSKWMLVQE